MEKTAETKYKSFETFVFRTPHTSFNEFEKNLKRLETDESYWKEFLQSKVLQEAPFC